MTTAEVIEFVLIAFGAGVTLPLAVQLFLTLRTMHRTLVSTGRRVEQTLDSLDAAAKRAQQSVSPATRTITAIGAALIPAIAVGMRAWHGERARAQRETTRAIDSRNGGDALAPSTSSKETSHARS